VLSFQLCFSLAMLILNGLAALFLHFLILLNMPSPRSRTLAGYIRTIWMTAARMATGLAQILIRKDLRLRSFTFHCCSRLGCLPVRLLARFREAEGILLDKQSSFGTTSGFVPSLFIVVLACDGPASAAQSANFSIWGIQRFHFIPRFSRPEPRPGL
jgi:hypothetical protein